MAEITTANAHKHSGVESLNALFKQVYGELKDLVPSNVKLLNIVDFAKAEKALGNEYNEPVVLGLEGGITYGGTEGTAFALNDIVSFPLKNAKVKSSEMVIRSAISTGVVSRSATSKNAFERGIKLLSGNMMKSIYHRLEVSMLYGQESIGEVEALGGFDANGDFVAGAGTNQVIKIKDQEWAAGIWVGTVKHRIDLFDPTLATARGTLSISSYDLDQRTISVSGDPVAAGILADDRIFFQGSYDVVEGHKDMLGLHSIAEVKGVLFGINNVTEPLFQGNCVCVGADVANPAVLSFAKVEEAVARSVEKGLQEEEMTVMVNVNSWNDLLTEQTGKRRYDSSYSSSEVQEGAKSIKFFGQAGDIKIIPSTYVKEGYAYAFCEKDLIRIGSSDVTFEPMGYEGDYFKLLEGANGYELRAYSDQALFTSRPSCITILKYIQTSRSC